MRSSDPEAVAQSRVDEPGGGWVGGLVDELERLVQPVDGLFGLAGVVGHTRPLAGAARSDPAVRLRRARRRERRPSRSSAVAVVLRGRGRRVDTFGGLGRGDRRPEGLARPIGAEPVVGDLGRSPRPDPSRSRPRGSDSTIAKRSWRARRSAGRSCASTTSPSRACRSRSVASLGSGVEDAGGDGRPDRLADLGLRALGDGRDRAPRSIGRPATATMPSRRCAGIRQAGDLAGQRLGQGPRQPLRAAARVRRRRAPRRRTGCHRTGRGCGRPWRRPPGRRGAGRPGARRRPGRAVPGPGGSSACRARGWPATSRPDGPGRDRRSGR